MSKKTLIKEIRKEINNLNIEIDMKILKGLSYKKESKRHKFLMSQLRSISHQSSLLSNWLGNIFYGRV